MVVPQRAVRRIVLQTVGREARGDDRIVRSAIAEAAAHVGRHVPQKDRQVVEDVVLRRPEHRRPLDAAVGEFGMPFE